MQTRRITGDFMDKVEDICKRAVQIANDENCDVILEANGAEFDVRPGMTWQDVFQAYYNRFPADPNVPGSVPSMYFK